MPVHTKATRTSGGLRPRDAREPQRSDHDHAVLFRRVSVPRGPLAAAAPPREPTGALTESIEVPPRPVVLLLWSTVLLAFGCALGVGVELLVSKVSMP